jgi:putative solute:sodium symporter small subunit
MMSDRDTTEAARYWRTNLKLVGCLLVVWFLVSYGAGILFVEPLNEIHMGGFPLGFWFAQQGSIVVFIVLILVYCLKMDRIDAAFREAATDPGQPSPEPTADPTPDPAAPAPTEEDVA